MKPPSARRCTAAPFMAKRAISVVSRFGSRISVLVFSFALSPVAAGLCAFWVVPITLHLPFASRAMRQARRCRTLCSGSTDDAVLGSRRALLPSATGLTRLRRGFRQRVLGVLPEGWFATLFAFKLPRVVLSRGMKAVSKKPRFCEPTLLDYLALSTYGCDAGRDDARPDRQRKMLAQARRKTGKPACFVFWRGFSCHVANAVSQHRDVTPRA